MKLIIRWAAQSGHSGGSVIKFRKNNPIERSSLRRPKSLQRFSVIM
jgi:hypothetical protein